MARMRLIPTQTTGQRSSETKINEKKFMRTSCLKSLTLVLALVGMFSCLPRASAQRIVRLVEFTNSWRYEQSGANLGTAWRTNNFNDTAWATGRGILAAEDAPGPYNVHAPINTTLAVGPTGNVTTNFYFRTHFNFLAADFKAGLTLTASNLVDDGCVIYLNGMQAGLIRLPANPTSATYATGGTPTEGAIEVLSIATNLLRVGDNVLAVEVHQVNATSSDVAWGTLLVASVPTAPVITNQPDSLTVTVGSAVTFDVGFSGGPVTYQWQKESTPGSGVWGVVGSSPTFTIASVVLSSAGNYRVVLSNSVGVAISTTAVLTVVDDRSGPVMLRAEVQETTTGATNRIIIYWNERLLSGTAISTNNYRITHLNNTNSPLPFVAGYQSAPPLTLLTLNTNAYTNWFVNGLSNYIITVNNVRDVTANTNVVAPNSQVGVSWPTKTNIFMAGGPTWNYHNSFGDEDLMATNWYATNFVMSDLWGTGNAPFGRDPFIIPLPTCLGGVSGFGFQRRPSFFRTTFVLPTNQNPTARLDLNYVIDDGAVFYLNGVEILRYNLPAAPAVLTFDSRAVNNIVDTLCNTNFVNVTNLLPRTNWLAVAVFQSNAEYVGPSESDIVFGLDLDASTYRVGPVPPKPITNPVADKIILTKQGTTNIFSWGVRGYALEATTNLAAAVRYGTNVVNGTNRVTATNYYAGPWFEVQPNMSNPWTNNPSGKARIFRLRKTQLQ